MRFIVYLPIYKAVSPHRRRYSIDIIGRRRMKLMSTSDLDGYRVAQVLPSFSKEVAGRQLC